MKKIGIMGGTFNPIHIGHLLLAESAAEEFGLEEIWLIPTGCSYMKEGTGVLSAAKRYEMTCLAVRDNKKMRCLDIEVKREGYTYSYETMEALKEQFPEGEFYFISGADCLFSVEKWKWPERFFSCCQMIAAVREGADLSKMEIKRRELQEKFHGKIHLFAFRNLEISSTDIRERVRLGKSIRYLVPDRILSYIEEKGLYRL